MTKLYKKMLVPLLCIVAGTTQLFAQTTVSGTVTDGATQQGLPGVNIVVKGKVAGTITDKDGKYSLKVNQAPPFTITFSFIGFHTEEHEVTDASTTFDLPMKEESLLGQEVVVSASRVEENILKSPVTIEKLDQIAIKQSATPDFFDALASMKGVQVNNGSLNFTAVNTRGFATIANTRFVQWVDGMDTQAPLLNFPTGTIMGLNELDAESIELIPGAASALYGPNAFNGIMIMKSKSPFEYQGLSAQVKQGITNSNAGGSNPYGMYTLRYAKAFNDKLAFKVNFSYMKATDWTSNDYKTDKVQNVYSNLDYSSAPNFDGMNKYGDESNFNVPIGGTFGTLNLNRTGFKESTLLDNRDAITMKGDVALHYRITDKVELIGAYRYGGGNSLYQGNAKYALRDFNQQFYKLELKGDNFFVRGYLSATDAGKSYHMDALGAYLNEAISPTATQWAPDYGQAYVLTLQGYTPGVPAGNVAAAHAAARAYADRNIFDPSGNILPAVQDTINKLRHQFFQKRPKGASFYDNSKLWHAEVYYNFNKVKWAEIIAGGNFRQYSLFSNGTIFDEGPDDPNNFKRIFINQFGVYTQISKTVAENLKLTGSIRYDKSDNFEGHFTPRVSAVYSMNQNHNFRASFQTGFRNPDTQAQYIYFSNGPGIPILLGGVIGTRYGVYGNGAWTKSSYDAYVASGGSVDASGNLSGGDQTKLQDANLQPVKPEQMWSYEVGYKGVIASKVLVDLNYYYTSYSDFLNEAFVVSKQPTTHQGQTVAAGQPWYPYTNSPYKITSQGIGLGLTYNLPKSFVLTGNYNWANFTNSGASDPNFQSNFNTPTNRYSVGIGNRKIVKNLGANVNFRYQDSFWWESSYGVGTIPAYGIVDAQISYKVSPIKSVIKIGGTNLGGGDYRTNIGAPFIGQMYYVSLTFDEFLK